MRIMILGAGGFIGRQILAELNSAGHETVAVVRKAGNLAEAFPGARLVLLDLARALDPEEWHRHLQGIDLVVNAAGVLRGRDMKAIHVAMPNALIAAAQSGGCLRIVLISAISARSDVATDYSLAKLAGEEALRRSGLGWTILRPSLVYGDGSYGGTSLLRGLAALPFAIPLPEDGRFAFTPIHLRDLAIAVRRVCESSDFCGKTLEPVGPETFNLKTLLCRYRIWLGFGPAHFVRIPMPTMRLFARIGDLAGDGPVSTNSLEQLIAGNCGNSVQFSEEVGFRPRSLAESMRMHPAQVQDRWHARLFFLAPALRAMLVLLWLASALLGLFHGAPRTAEVVSALGLAPQFADPLRIASSTMDVAIAVMVAFDRRAFWSTPIQLAAVAGYTAVIGLALPHLWLDPLGPLLKNLPILLAIAVHGAIAGKR